MGHVPNIQGLGLYNKNVIPGILLKRTHIGGLISSLAVIRNMFIVIFVDIIEEGAEFFEKLFRYFMIS